MNPGRPFFFAPFAKGLFFVLNLLALYLLLRGHHEPGGGFIAGLVTAISLVLLSLALGWEATGRWLRVDPARLAYGGLLLAGGTAVAPLVAGRSLLEHGVATIPVPFVGEVALGTTLAFDAGVFLVVVGITAKMVIVLARSSHGLGAFRAGEAERYAASVEEPIEPSVIEGSVSGSEADTGRGGVHAR